MVTEYAVRERVSTCARVAIRGYYLGCPGWGLRAWVGRLFPAGTKSTDYLARYADVFNTVEGNTTFYALPAADQVERWRAQVPASFRFCFKFPRAISHDRMLAVDCERGVAEFLARVTPLGERLGTLFVQLPPRFAICSGCARSSQRCRASCATRSRCATPSCSSATSSSRCSASAASISS